HQHLNVSYLLTAGEDDALTVREGENTGVAWLPADRLTELTNEWQMDYVYRKLLRRPGLCWGWGKESKKERWNRGSSALRLSKKSLDFFDSLQKCRYFRAAQRRKSPRSALRTPCTARRPGHSFPREAGG